MEVDNPSTSTTEFEESGGETSLESSDECGADYECEDQLK